MPTQIDSPLRPRRLVALSALVCSLVLSSWPAAARAETPPLPDPFWASEPSVAVKGNYVPLVGDFDADGLDDIYWYAPTGTDHLWLGRGQPGAPFRDVAAPQVKNAYRPLVGDFAGDRADDIIWYAPGERADRLWTNRAGGGRPVDSQLVITGDYDPFVIDDPAGKDAVVWYRPDRGTAQIWTFTNPGRGVVYATVPPNARPITGNFDGIGRTDIFWYVPGPSRDHVTWRTTPTSVQTIPTAINVRGDWDVVAARIDDDEATDLFFQKPMGSPGGLESTSAPVWFGSSDRTFLDDVRPSAPGHPLLMPSRTSSPDWIVLHGAVPRDHVVYPGDVGPTRNTPIQRVHSALLVGYFTGAAHPDLLAYGEGGFRTDQLYLGPAKD